MLECVGMSKHVPPDVEAAESALTDISITPLAPSCKFGITTAGNSAEVHFQASMVFIRSVTETMAASAKHGRFPKVC